MPTRGGNRRPPILVLFFKVTELMNDEGAKFSDHVISQMQ